MPIWRLLPQVWVVVQERALLWLPKACRERGIWPLVLWPNVSFRRLSPDEDGWRRPFRIAKLCRYIDCYSEPESFRVVNDKTTFADGFVKWQIVFYSRLCAVWQIWSLCLVWLILILPIFVLLCREMGKAVMGLVTQPVIIDATEAAEKAINNPLLDDVFDEGC